MSGLKEWFRKNNMTQNDAAEATGQRRETVNRHCAGGPVSISARRRYIKLGVPVRIVTKLALQGCKENKDV